MIRCWRQFANKGECVMDQVEYILDEFPFDDVWQAMRAVGWQWGSPPYYPTFTELRCTAKSLLESAWVKQTRASTRGFEATYEDGVLELCFVLASASTEDIMEE